MFNIQILNNCALAASVVLGMAGVCTAEQPPSLVDMVEVMMQEITIGSTKEGNPVYPKYCLRQRGGCRAMVTRQAKYMVESGEKHDVDPLLVAAVAINETRLNPNAVGAVGERGIMQLHPKYKWGKRANKACRHQPRRCTRYVIDSGTRLLSRCQRRCGTVERALGRYNTGTCRENRYSRKVRRIKQRMRLRMQYRRYYRRGW